MNQQTAFVIRAIVVALKFGLPLLILRYPFGAGWANFVLDSIDGDILSRAGMADTSYQTIDKLADWLTYLCMVGWGWSRPVKRLFLGLFLFRSVGQAAFLLTHNELWLFFFPNFLEPIFLVYVTIARIKGWDRVHEIYTRFRAPIWLGILLYKLQDEYVTHVGNIDRSDLIQRWFGG